MSTQSLKIVILHKYALALCTIFPVFNTTFAKYLLKYISEHLRKKEKIILFNAHKIPNTLPHCIITPIWFKFYGANSEYDDAEMLVLGKIEKLFSSFKDFTA
jgi:hypothetical protein